MPSPSEKIDNVAALAKREDKDGNPCNDNEGRIPRRWAGIVEANHGAVVVVREKGEPVKSGEKYIEIRSPALQQTVFAKANEDRKPGEKVQFCLDGQGEVFGMLGAEGRAVGTTWFEEQRDHSDSSIPESKLEWKPTPKWREDMVHE